MGSSDESLASLDLSWARSFHTVNIARWSEPPGPDGFACATWRVLVGAFGHYVSSNHASLKQAIAEVVEKVERDPLLRTLLPDPAAETPSRLHSFKR